MGPELEFTEDAIVAVTGAAMTPKVDGEPQENWTSFAVKSGPVLSFDFLKGGARAYIAVSGGIDVPVVLGSRSTYVLGALGGFDGRGPCRPGRRTAGRAAAAARRAGRLPEDLRRAPGSPAEMRVLPGIYWHRVTDELGRTVLRGHLEGGAGSRPHRLPLPRRQSALEFSRARAALRRRLRPFEHRRWLLSLRLDPGAGRHRADRACTATRSRAAATSCWAR